MSTSPAVVATRVHHKRFSPKENAFAYRLAYLSLPLSRMGSLSARPFFAINKPALLSFWNKDHGNRQGKDLRSWASEVLNHSGIDDVDGEIVLVTLPRLFGYVFNPVSFWLCHRADGQLRAVIAEVNNTFGETHAYICACEDGSEISGADRFYANKEFHVSPFFQRSGYYRFRFVSEAEALRINIDYFDKNGDILLVTSIAGKNLEWTKGNLLKAWLSSPLMSIKAIVLIHWQALKLIFKSASYRSKPTQNTWYQTLANRVDPRSTTRNNSFNLTTRNINVSESC